jgi:hypothetical protein
MIAVIAMKTGRWSPALNTCFDLLSSIYLVFVNQDLLNLGCTEFDGL